MRLLLLNQFGPESGAPTGRILAELGAALHERGHTIVLLSADSKYGKSGQGGKRILGEMLAHWLLLWRSLWSRRIDAVLSLTSPACLAITADLIATFHQARHFHWIMDLYPEVGERLGEVKSEWFSQRLRKLMRRAYLRAARLVAVDEDMREYLWNDYKVEATVIQPFPQEVSWPRSGKEEEPSRRWLYSGNFGRAHEIEILLQIQKKLEDRGVGAELVLQGKGPQFFSGQATANRLGLRQIQWRPPVPGHELAESLLWSRVLVVTRKAEMKGLLLPSKLILAELSGRSVLWIGDTDGETSGRLRRAGRHGVFAMEESESIALWLQAQFNQDSPIQVIVPQDTRPVRQQCFRQWEKLLEE